MEIALGWAQWRRAGPEPKVATMAAQSDEFCTDEEAEAMLAPALQTITDYYEARSIFQVPKSPFHRFAPTPRLATLSGHHNHPAPAAGAPG